MTKLSTLVLPLVQLLMEDDITWSERENITSAIGACRRHWVAIEKERQLSAGQGLQGLATQHQQGVAITGYGQSQTSNNVRNQYPYGTGGGP